MKIIFSAVILLALLASCKKEKASNEIINDTINPNATVLVKGNFSGANSYTVNGTVEIINDNNQKKLVFKNFNSSNGPDLRVYLATTTGAFAFISLGNLKSTNGQQVYDISGMPDFAQYKFALIWCQQFSVLFGSAELK
ncbi:MAG: DM13 domain-containing protein [Chitinophagaceae bacterium]|jgi:hypothetical protein